MEGKQFFNELPRPTFRWTKVNHLESELQVVDTTKVAKSIALSGDIDAVHVLHDTRLMNTNFAGASKESLTIAANEFNVAYEIVAKTNEKKRIQCVVAVDEASPSQIFRLRVTAEANARIDVMYILQGTPSSNGVVHLLTEVKGEENANITIHKVQLLGSETQHIEHRYASLADSASVQYVNVELGGKENIYYYETTLGGVESNIDHDLAYLGNDNQRFDISLIMTHKGRKSTSNIKTVGALSDASKKTFRGTLDFLQGSVASEGGEEDTCLLLSDKAKSISLPLLLCKEDNVVGNHAASAGQLEANKLFYLMSRGFSESEAKHILVESMLRPIIDKIEDEELGAKVLDVARGKI